VIAVCDAFDAMTAKPAVPGRSRGTAKGAVAELRRCAGSQFDPTAVEAFSRTRAERRGARAAPLA
jgi:HD-GYP domain-containing protein (c-di-GMP phosphodiesterase class II)